MGSKLSQHELPPCSWRGGAQIDLQNAAYPFATLAVSSDELELRVAQMSYRFRPDQVRAIEAVRAVPILGKGIRIHHDITGYPQLVIFWTMGNPEALASHLREYGYGTDPDAKYDKTDFPAERLTCLMMAIMLVLFLLLPGLSILSWLVLFVFSGR